jgi:hypothetical protein
MSALANPVIWIVAAVLLLACSSSVDAVGRLGRILTHPAALLALAIVVTANLGVRVALGLVAPGDFAGEIIAARSIESGGSMYSADLVRDRVAVRQIAPGPLVSAVASWLPASLVGQARERNSVGIAAQAHPPTVLALIAPLVLLTGAEPAFVLVSTFSVVAAFGLAWCLVSAVVPRPEWRHFAVGALLVAGWQPSLAAIRDGQLSVVIAACAICGWWALRRAREAAGGVLVGIATVLKFYPAALMLALAVRSRRALAWAIVAGALAVVATIAAFGVQPWLAYRDVVADGALGHLASGTNLSVAARLAHVFPRAVALDLWAVGSVILLALTLWRSRREREFPASIDLSFARFSCLAIALSPTAWGHYLPLLAQPFAILLRSALDARDRGRLVAAAGLALLLSVPIAETTGIWSLGITGWTNALLSPTTAILVLWAVLMVEAPGPRS